ncbi:GYF domain-containing protein [Planctomicrobium sp. SH527]|uniref:GYF domain-containing protein n=1 Tax=Planctomicrobium sp. SH527 TaxID=3448123 RepID=UPI003F5B9135
MSDLNSPRHFVRISGKILGPFGQDQLRSLRSRGRLHADHEVSVDRRTWLPATSLVELFGEPAGAKQSNSSTSATVPEDSPSSKSVEWFYAIGDEQQGPVTFSDLKKLAARGELTHRDMVWHSGLVEWIPAGDQPGLISSPRSSSRQRSAGSLANENTPGQSQTFLWSLVLQQLRVHFAATQLQQFVRSLSAAGGFSLTLAMYLELMFFVTLSIKLDSVQFMFAGLGIMLVISVLKYIGIHSLQAGDALIRTTPNQISSPAPVNMASVVLLSTGILCFCSLLYLGIYESKFDIKVGLFILAGEILFVLGMAACFLLQTSWMNVEIVSSSRAGQEGIAILSFILKLFVRVSSFTFAISSILAAAGFGIAAFAAMFADDISKSSEEIYSLCQLGVIHALIAGIVPLVAYLIFVSGSIFLDVCQFLMNPAPARIAQENGHSHGTKSGGYFDE